MAVKLIYHVLAMLLSWMVLHARSDTTKRSKSSCCAINWACCSDAYPGRGPAGATQVVHVGHQRGGGLIAGMRIAALQEVGVVAMRRRIRQLVTIGRPTAPNSRPCPAR